MSSAKTVTIINAFQAIQSRKRKAVCEPKLEDKISYTEFNKQTNTCTKTSKTTESSDTLTPERQEISDVLKEILNKVPVKELCQLDNEVKLVNGYSEQGSPENLESHNSTLDKTAISTDNEDLNNSTINSSTLTLNSSTISSDFSSPMAGPSSSSPSVPNVQKRRQKMSPAEAKRRTEIRALKEKLKEEKRLAKQEEKLKKENEKKLQKLEKQQKKEEEEREKERLRQEKKEQEEKEKQRKQLEREEQLKLKLMIQEAKAQEKKKKEELKLKALEEKKKMEEEKMKIELEKEKKKALSKQAFEKFFLKNSSSTISTPSPQPSIKESVFRPFQISRLMTLAPVVPIAAKDRFDKEQLDHYLKNQGSSISYLEMLKSDKYKPVRYKQNKKKASTDEEIVILDSEFGTPYLKAKLLQFRENIRPPYWGTWRKKSKIIGPRKPFKTDIVLFDYEADSEEEWEEGGPGESLTGTEDEESEDDYEVDNEFFVPHGYLSAEEEGEEGDEDTPIDPEAQQARLKMKEKEFLNARSKKTTALWPIVMGCYFKSEVDSGNPLLEKAFREYKIEIITTKDILTAFTIGKKLNTSDHPNCSTSPSDNKTPNKRPVPEEAYPYLIRLLHGNTNGRPMVIKEFQHFWIIHCKKLENLEGDLKENSAPPNEASSNVSSTPTAQDKCKISKRQLRQCITAIATWCKPSHPTLKKMCWWVKDEIIQKYGLKDLPIPNEWSYTCVEDKEEALPDQSPRSLKMSSSQ